MSKVRWYEKYNEVDFDNMSDEEFFKMYKNYKRTLLFGSVFGGFLFIIVIVLIILGGVYFW